MQSAPLRHPPPNLPQPPAEERTSPSAPAGETSRSAQIWRVWLVAGGLTLLMMVVVARLVHHQFLGWLNQSTRVVRAESGLPRGVVLDRHGQLLAADRFFYRIVADPSAIRTDEERRAVAERLEQLIGLPAGETLLKLTEAPNRRYVELAKRVSLTAGEQVQALKDQDAAAQTLPALQSLSVAPAPERYYPQGTLASHLLGFVRADRAGAYGLEEYYDAYLDPGSGIGLLEKSQAGLDALPSAGRQFVPSLGGKDLVLTLDSGVQLIIESELERALKKYGATGGAIIVMEPATGAVLGMANWPQYDPNRYSQETDYGRFVNPSISLLYEPGSIFKVVTMAAALDTGVITPTTLYTDFGSITVGQRVIFNSNRVGYGHVTATEALARSLNVVTAEIAVQMGSERFYRYVERFGFTQLTEVDLADEVAGLVKAPGNPDWSVSDLGTNSFGQGLAVTPMEMINAVAAIANQGRLMRPYVVQARIEGDEVLLTRPTLIRPVVKPEVARQLTLMMVATVRTGNAAAGIGGYRIAGKSGTAQIPGPNGYEQDATIVSFIGFAPADDPRFAVLVKLDRPDPKISIWATHTAAPVFAQVTRRLFDYFSIPPDEVRLGRERVLQLEAETFGGPTDGGVSD